MGAYKYVSELYRKKQSDVMRYLLRIRYDLTPFFPKLRMYNFPKIRDSLI